MPVLDVAEVHALVCTTLERCNTSPENARSVATALVDAELAGQAGHGMGRVPSYAGQAASGKVDGHAAPVAETRASAVLRVDAKNGFAYPALDLVHAQLPQMARDCGIAIAGLTRSHHCGVAGVIVEKFAAQNLVAMMFANTPAAMAPWGGSNAVFGTNPIAFAAPRGKGAPIVVDVSLSKVARGKLMAAKQKGESLPDGWALDASGQPTTDPDVGLKGTMVPMGDAKGTALALMVELLAAGLTGSNYADEASSFFEADGPPPGVGQSIIAIDPTKFGGSAIIDHFGVLAAKIEGQEGARVPGARRLDIREKLTREGITIADSLLAEIEEIGR